MKSTGDAKVILAIMVGLVVFMVMTDFAHGAAELYCNHVEALVFPCVKYVTGGALKPSAACCNGVATLKKEALVTGQRREICECLTNVASHTAGIKKDLVARLPKECVLDFSIPISPAAKCSDVS